MPAKVSVANEANRTISHWAMTSDPYSSDRKPGLKFHVAIQLNKSTAEQWSRQEDQRTIRRWEEQRSLHKEGSLWTKTTLKKLLSFKGQSEAVPTQLWLSTCVLSLGVVPHNEEVQKLPWGSQSTFTFFQMPLSFWNCWTWGDLPPVHLGWHTFP